MERVCGICNGRGIVGNRVCKCVIEGILSKRVPVELNKYKISKTIKQVCDKVKQCNIYFGGGKINNIEPKAIIKAIIVHRILSDYKFEFFYGSVKDVFDIFMSPDNEFQSRITNNDLLVMKIGNEFSNSYIQELVPFILGERISKNKQTILLWDNFVNDKSQDKVKFIKERYSSDTYEYIVKEFVIADKKLVVDNYKLCIGVDK